MSALLSVQAGLVVPLALAVFVVALALVYLRLRWWARRYAEVVRQRDDLAQLRRRTSCPKCDDPACVAPGRCDDPEHFFGGIGP